MKTPATSGQKTLPLGQAKIETRGVSSPSAPDEWAQHKPMPGLTAD